LSETPEPKQMLGTAVARLEDFYKDPVLILTVNEKGELVPTAGNPSTFGWNENELSVAKWVFDKRQMAGAGSDTLSAARSLYVPMKGLRHTMGVLAVGPSDAKALLEPEQLQLLETFAGEIGGALESTHMSEAIGRAEREMELEAISRAKSDTAFHLGGL